MTSFNDILSEGPILNTIQELGFDTPTPVQASTLPLARDGHDLIVQAKTGSGKTLAFCLPLLLQLEKRETKNDSGFPFGIIIAPTRELALQITDVITSFRGGESPPCLIGGEDPKKQIKSLEKNSQIVVGTPGRILDFMNQKLIRLSRCRFFALDEADEMLSMGFLEDIRAILGRLPDKRQGLFVSATITPRVEMIANAFLTSPKSVLVDDPEEDFPPIEHFYCEVSADVMAKPLALSDIIETYRPRSAIIFCNTKSDTELVEALLRRRGFDARRINSDLNQAKRSQIMEKIRAEELQFLVATDIAARGLDLDQIDLVINYAIHEQPEIYVHRTGRTGRAGRSGKAISLIGPRDFGFFHHVKKILNIDFEKLTLPSDQDVADARLTHVYEILKNSQIETKMRDTLVAKKMLAELGNISEPTEELEATIAKLSRHCIEHFIQLEASSLDEELEESRLRQEKKDREKKDKDGEKKSKRRDKDRNQDKRKRSRRRD